MATGLGRAYEQASIHNSYILGRRRIFYLIQAMFLHAYMILFLLNVNTIQGTRATEDRGLVCKWLIDSFPRAGVAVNRVG